MESRAASTHFSSPVPHLLGTNNVATDQEKEDIELFIETLNDRVKEIDQEMDTLLLKKKREERATITDAIRRHKAITHPVRTLAPELLTEIFYHCQRGGPTSIIPEVPDSFHPLEGPMLLTHICRHWRTVAVSSPRLWTTLRVPYGFPIRSKSQLQSQVALAKLWISRSGTAPLEICFHINDIINTMELKQNLVFQAVLGSLIRWSSIYIITFLPHDVLSVLSPCTKYLSMVKKYKLVSPEILHNGRRRAQTPYRVHLLPGFISWPTSMVNVSIQAGFNVGGFSLPLGQLTMLEIYSELDAAYITIKQFFLILTQGPNLQDLRVRCLGIDLNSPDPNSLDMDTLTEHSHPQLQALHIAVVNDGYIIDPLLQHAAFPSLKTFVIGSPTGQRPWSHAAIVKFLDRTAGSIQELEMIGRGVPWSEVAQCFSRTPNASRVSIIANSLGDYEFNKTYDALYRLKYLRLEGQIFISSGAFAEFLRRRCEGPIQREGMASLASLEIRCLGETTEFIDAGVFEKLSHYSEKGTRIRIETDYACLFPRTTFLSRRFQ